MGYHLKFGFVQSSGMSNESVGFLLENRNWGHISFNSVGNWW